MLNLIQGKLVIANPANITPNSQTSISEKVTLQHYVIARRREPTKQSISTYFPGLLRCSKATPRNDVSLLWLDSLSRKSGSMVGNDYSMVLLSSSLKQPIYVFENVKMLQSYGKSQGGKAITIGYNPTNQQYFSLTNKGSNNSGSIYDAISGSTQGKYSSDFLQSIACPIVPKEPLNPPSPSTPQPKPLSPAELSGAKFLLATLTADKQAAQAKQQQYYQNILQIAGQNMCDAEAKKLARDETLMQQAYATGGSMGLDIPKIIKPMEGCKTTGDTDKNIADYFNNPNSKYANNQLVKSVAQAGEVIEWAGSNFAYAVSHMEGGRETLAAIGAVVGGAIDGVKYVAKGATKIVLPKDVYNHIAQHYNDLPRGVQISLETALLSAMPVGTVVKVAGNTIGKIPLANVPKLLAVKPIPHIPIDPLPLVKSKYYNPLLAIEDGVGKISADTGAVLTKPTIPLESKPTTSSVVTKVEHKLPMSLVVGENIKPIIQLEAPQFIAEIEIFAKKHDWSNLPEIIKSLPEGYNFTNYAKGDKTIGIEFAKGTHNKIALKKAKLDADYPSQKVDYVSYRVNGNMHVARNGDLIYESKGNIMRRDYITDQVSVMPTEELQRLGITNPKNFPEVHIPMDEFFNKIDEFIKKWEKKNEYGTILALS